MRWREKEVRMDNGMLALVTAATRTRNALAALLEGSGGGEMVLEAAVEQLDAALAKVAGGAVYS